MSDQDVAAITRLINLYGIAVDSQRWALFDAIFTPDVDADYGEGSHWRDLARFKSDFATYHAPFDATQHGMTNHLVTVGADRATALTYGSWLLIRRGVAGGDNWQGRGWYDDALVRTGDGWRIRHRTCRVIWWGGNPLVNAPAPGISFKLDLTSLRAQAEAGRVGWLGDIGAP